MANGFFKSLLNGKWLLRLGVDRYLPQIVFAFIMATAYIALNITIDNSIMAVEQQKKTIKDLTSIHTDLKCKLTALNSVCALETMLQESKSDLAIPHKQAKKIER